MLAVNKIRTLSVKLTCVLAVELMYTVAVNLTRVLAVNKTRTLSVKLTCVLAVKLTYAVAVNLTHVLAINLILYRL